MIIHNFFFIIYLENWNDALLFKVLFFMCFSAHNFLSFWFYIKYGIHLHSFFLFGVYCTFRTIFSIFDCDMCFANVILTHSKLVFILWLNKKTCIHTINIRIFFYYIYFTYSNGLSFLVIFFWCFLFRRGLNRINKKNISRTNKLVTKTKTKNCFQVIDKVTLQFPYFRNIFCPSSCLRS